MKDKYTAALEAALRYQLERFGNSVPIEEWELKAIALLSDEETPREFAICCLLCGMTMDRLTKCNTDGCPVKVVWRDDGRREREAKGNQ